MAGARKEFADDVQAYLDAIGNEARRLDCAELARIMRRATGMEPRMWGSIVGFGSYHYRYESGREGDSCLVGFASRAGDISLYLSSETPGRDSLLGELGAHKEGKGCVYVKRLSDLKLPALERLVAASAQERRRRYPG